MKYYLVCLVGCLTIIASSVFAFQGDSIIVTLTMPRKNIDTFTNLRVNVEIWSKGNILVPHEENWALIHDSSGFLCLQLQKKDGNNYNDMISSARIDNLFITDKVDTLRANEKYKSAFDIWALFPFFDKGEYRVRVLCRTQGLYRDNPYSNWFYFNCKKKISRGKPAWTMEGN